MKRFFGMIRRAPKRTAGLLMVAAAIIVPAIIWAWGPERPTFTVENAAPYVTFNSNQIKIKQSFLAAFL